MPQQRDRRQICAMSCFASVEAINIGLQSLKSGGGALGEIAVVVASVIRPIVSSSSRLSYIRSSSNDAVHLTKGIGLVPPVPMRQWAPEHYCCSRNLRNRRDFGKVLLQQVERHGQQDHVFHQEGDVSDHRRKPSGRCGPTVGHEGDDRDCRDEGEY